MKRTIALALLLSVAATSRAAIVTSFPTPPGEPGLKSILDGLIAGVSYDMIGDQVSEKVFQAIGTSPVGLEILSCHAWDANDYRLGWYKPTTTNPIGPSYSLTTTAFVVGDLDSDPNTLLTISGSFSPGADLFGLLLDDQMWKNDKPRGYLSSQEGFDPYDGGIDVHFAVFKEKNTLGLTGNYLIAVEDKHKSDMGAYDDDHNDLVFRMSGAQIPEPASLFVLSLGGIIVASARRRRLA